VLLILIKYFTPNQMHISFKGDIFF
jgi:hypothetical protein